MLTTKPRGTNDFLPGDVEEWQALEMILYQIFKTYGYHEIRTPIFEHTELFLRSVGESSDIVEKEMYTFEDKGLRSVTLRPEGTASTVRAFIENKLYSGPMPMKLYYSGPMFRYDQPQAGRYRQFHQFGAEVLGSKEAVVDAEIIAFSVDLFSRLGIEDLAVKINTVGCDECRPAYQEALKKYFEGHRDELCPACLRRLDTNPLRILDCKEESCKRVSDEAPATLDYACDNCRTHFGQLRDYLDATNIDYEVDFRLVRGLDYYTQTAFEVVINKIGSQQNALCGGGRYNKLAEQIGGEDIPGMGFAAGMERLLLTLKEQGVQLHRGSDNSVYLAVLGDKARVQAFKLLQALRLESISSEMDYLSRSLKAQMKSADRNQARYTIIIGDDELDRGEVVVRDMQTSEQVPVPIEKVLDYIKEGLKNVTIKEND